jgi:hypothetical protein
MPRDSNLTMKTPLNKNIYYTLRIAAAMCFIGHGAFGIITKPIWCNYFAVFGIGQDLAYTLMPIVGSIDIMLGLTMLLYPLRVIPGWLVVWGFITAMLRPLSGEPFWEFIERAGNFGAPLALLVLAGGSKNIKGWLSPIDWTKPLSKENYRRLFTCLKVFAFLLLLGHGALNLSEKKGLLDQYARLGLSEPGQVAQLVGVAEIVAAFTILIRPFPSLIFILFLWKMSAESFYPHYKLFEWIERGGSYGVLLALWLLSDNQIFLRRQQKSRPLSGLSINFLQA